MADETINVGIEVEASGNRDTEALANAVAHLQEATESYVDALKKSLSVMNKAEKSLAGITSETKKTADAEAGHAKELGDGNDEWAKRVQHLNDMVQKYREYRQEVAMGSWKEGSVGFDEFDVDEIRKTREAMNADPIRDATKAQKEYLAQLKQNSLYQAKLKDDADKAAAAEAAAQEKVVAAVKKTVNDREKLRVDSEKRQAAEINRANEQEAKARLDRYNKNKQLREREAAEDLAAIKKQAKARLEARKAAEAAEAAANTPLARAQADAARWANMSNVRYAMHDVSMTLAVAGAAITGFNALVLGASMKYQDAMATIQRTSGAAGDELRSLQKDFIGLAQSIPESFENLAEIGALAGQLGIASDNVANFTKIVAMFTATTDVTVDKAAEAFGRLDTLLPDVQGNFEALGSSLLHVGVNSVATESEIINTTNEIAAAGAQAGFTADQVIGLAASYASLGIRAEAARGSTIRIFSEITQAVGSGGEALRQFADLAGKTSEQFSADWANDAGQAFLDLMYGMQQAAAEGVNLEQTLRQMGITGVRDLNALVRMAQNAEVVGDNFRYAAAGMADGTQLADAFAIEAETMSSKLQMLVQTFEALLGALGESSLGPLGSMLDVIKSIAVAFTEWVRTPVGGWVTGVVGAVMGLLGVITLLGAATVRLGASGIALRQAWSQARLEMLSVDATLKTVAASSTLASRAFAGLKIALVSTGIGAALVAAGLAFEAIMDTFKTNADRAAEALGDISPLVDAVRKDTEELKRAQQGLGDMPEVYRELSVGIYETVDAGEDLNDISQTLTGTSVDLGDATEDLTRKVGEQTVAFGENAKEALKASLVTSDAYKALVNALREADDPQLTKSVAEILKVGLEGGVEEARAMFAELSIMSDEYKKSLELAGSATFEVPERWADTFSTISEVGPVLTLIEGQFERLATEMWGAEFAAKLFGDSVAEASDEVAVFDDILKGLRDSLNNAFAGENAMGQFAADAQALYEGLVATSDGFNVLSEAGRTNLNNLIQSMASTAAFGQTMGVDVTDSIAAQLLALQAMGIDTAQILSAVASYGIEGLNVGRLNAIVSGTERLSTGGSQLLNVLNGMGSAAKRAGTGLGKVGGGASKAAKEIRTLLDYAKDLSSVMSRAFDIRFGRQAGLDQIAAGWREIAEATEAANKAISKALATQLQLTSQKMDVEFWLSVAEAYGHQLQAAALRAELAEIENKIADNNKSLADAQAQASKELVGDSKAAEQNRKYLTGLIGSYQDYIEALASSGASQSTLRAEAARLQQEFTQQALSMGYNASQLGIYTVAFDDIKVAIDRVPRNVTIEADANPAITALNEFEAKARSSAATARSAAGSIAGGYRDAFNQILAMQKKFADAVELSAKISAAEKRLHSIPSLGQAIQLSREITDMKNRLKAMGFAGGGYTGNIGTRQIAGVVHGQEYVLNAQATRAIGVRNLDHANRTGQMPAGNGIVEFGPMTMRFLEGIAAKGGTIVIDGNALASSVNSTNAFNNRRGNA